VVSLEGQKMIRAIIHYQGKPLALVQFKVGEKTNRFDNFLSIFRKIPRRPRLKTPNFAK
jgi:hypothetical protein